MIYTVKKRLPSGSHNARCDEEGYHWPVGERFKVHKRGHPYRMYCKHEHLEQIGGEEVILCISQRLIDEYFEVQS